MITLYTFGEKFGLPDPSPFCMKAITLLRMAGLDFETAPCDPRKAPKGKGPWLDDNGTIVADTTFIRWHLEARHAIAFDKGLSPAETATAWAFEKMCEEHLYWAVVYERWMLDEHFDNGPRDFFTIVPAPLRPLVIKLARRDIKRNLWGHGIGRHSYAEIQRLAVRDIDSLADFLADKPFLMGDAPCGADASVHGAVSQLLSEQFQTPLLAATRRHANLVAYRDRGLRLWYPEHVAPRA
ncbi:MAG: glutathione S-transferase family protein [Hyphomicrobiaceae bacterium]